MAAELAPRLLRVVPAFALAASLLGIGPAASAAPGWQALISPSGGIRLIRGGRDFASLEPGLFEATWQGASLLPAKPGAVPGGDVLKGEIRAPGGSLVECELRVTKAANGLHLAYRITPQKEMKLNSLHVGMGIPVNLLTGGRYVVDGRAEAFPVGFAKVGLFSAPANALELVGPEGSRLSFRFDQPTPILVQDDRQWGPTFSFRFGPQMSGSDSWPAGKPLNVAFTLAATGGMAMDYDGPVTVEAGKDWIPLDTRLDIQPGSALDFSKLVAWQAPAGKLGRVIARGDHFVFSDRPDEPLRFYGCNLCFTAQYLTHADSDRLAERLYRLGYNAVRFHHYESTLVDRSGGTSTKLKPDMLDRLDYLFSALKERGIYVTTDLFVSRPVFNAEIWPGTSGDVGMDEYKMAVPANDRAFANYKAFATALLGHVNPYTKMTWAEDPTLAWISLINEGNPGNFLSLLKGNLLDDYTEAWDLWYTTRHPGAQIPALPLQDNAPSWAEMNVFLAENQRAFLERTKEFLRGELHCQALLTNDNAWTNPIQMEAVRPAMDYVDDHFYVDHPNFIERPWSLPSRCSNSSPVADGGPGGRSCAFVRLLDKPMACTEFNYAGPSTPRGVGGMLTGALGALQDWAAIWRFDYGSNRDDLFTPRPAGYFDLVSDPLNQAADRAAMLLFRRGDLRPAPHAVAVVVVPQSALDGRTSARGIVPSWNALAWVTRVGSWVGTPGAAEIPGPAQLAWTTPMQTASPQTASLDAYAPDADDQVLAGLRKSGWLSTTNKTNLADNVLESETGQVTIDGPADVLTIDTPRTAGGFAPAGKTIRTKDVSISVDSADATVWVSSVDGKPIPESKRLLITHLTDLQNSGAHFGDKSRRVLMAWGGTPCLVRDGKATITIRLSNAGDLAKTVVWGLDTSGKRVERIPARSADGALVVPLDVNANGKARMLYEIEVP